MIKKLIKKLHWTCASGEKICDLLRKRGVCIGSDCEIYKDVHWGSEPYLIKIGDKVRITSGVKFITHDGGIWVLRNNGSLPNADIFGQIIIGNNVHIGMDTIIMPGVTIGDNVIVGCGAVVTKDIPDNCVAAGVPAKVIETIEDYYQKNMAKCEFTKALSYDKKKEYLRAKYYL